jgi:hypothetical protein
MTTEHTEAERAAREVMSEWEVFIASDGNNSIRMRAHRSEDEIARAVVAAVRPIIEAEITQHPDVNNMNRGFGNCPHCLSPLVAHCHECLNNIERSAAHGAGWRMDHLSGFGCIAICPECRDDNP